MLAQQPRLITSPKLAFGLSHTQGLLTGDRRDHDSRDRLLRRVREEFREMPGMRLTDVQSARLFGLNGAVCTRVLAALMSEGALWKGADGRYAARARQ